MGSLVILSTFGAAGPGQETSPSPQKVLLMFVIVELFKSKS